MNIWNDTNFNSLSPAQRRAVEARVPDPAEGETKETPSEYLNRIGAGVAAVDSYVEDDRQEFRAALNEAADNLFDDGGFTAEQIGQLVAGLVAATPEKRAEVIALLLL